MKTNKLVYCALFAALTGILSLISIPTQPVPVNLAMFAVLLAGGMLGKKYGTLSIVVYILLGIVGIPVFAGFRAGVAVIAGPTGGYVLGYTVTAFVTGMVCEKTRKLRYTIPFMTLAVALCYAVGTIWYCVGYKVDFISAFMVCVLPFIVGDLFKIIIASVVIKKYKIN